MNKQTRTKSWDKDLRWKGILRPYSAQDVEKISGSLKIEHTLAIHGSKKLWDLLSTSPFVIALGAATGNQAVQQVSAGLKSIYLSGWQVAADQNDSQETYPDLSLYPAMSMPHLIRRVQKALQRQDLIDHMEGSDGIDWFVPIIADAEAGFGGVLNTFELVKAMIEAGVSAIHLEDQLSSAKKCGHMGGKVLVPTGEFIQKLVAARLATDVMNVPTLIIARTDAESASFMQGDPDGVDLPYIGSKTTDGLYKLIPSIDYAIKRACAFAPYADMVWCETQKPDLVQAKEFAQGIHEQFPGKWLMYNCSPSFNWSQLDMKVVQSFQEKLAEMGYKYQFVTLSGFHTLNASMFELASAYVKEGMRAYSRLQHQESLMEKNLGFRALKHQSFVGAHYFDNIQSIISSGNTSKASMNGSTEESQFV